KGWRQRPSVTSAVKAHLSPVGEPGDVLLSLAHGNGTVGTHGTKFFNPTNQEVRVGEKSAAGGPQPAGGGPMKHSHALSKLVEDSKTRIGETDIGEVKRRLDAGDKFHL